MGTVWVGLSLAETPVNWSHGLMELASSTSLSMTSPSRAAWHWGHPLGRGGLASSPELTPPARGEGRGEGMLGGGGRGGGGGDEGGGGGGGDGPWGSWLGVNALLPSSPGSPE